MGGTKYDFSHGNKVNHEINLINDNKRYHYYLPHCPHSLREEFHKKINWYMDTGWWEPRSVSQATLMLCIQKKDGHLQTVINVHQQNNNTVKDVTPLPDQEIIREDIA